MLPKRVSARVPTALRLQVSETEPMQKTDASRMGQKKHHQSSLRTTTLVTTRSRAAKLAARPDKTHGSITSFKCKEILGLKDLCLKDFQFSDSGVTGMQRITNASKRSRAMNYRLSIYLSIYLSISLSIYLSAEQVPAARNNISTARSVV